MTLKIRENPHLLEVNALIFLRRMSKKYGRALTLGNIPEEEWRDLAAEGFDAVWFMGVWRRSPAAKKLALSHPELKRAYDEALPGWTEKDVTGSPYAVHAYEIDAKLGNSNDLAKLKSELNRAGVALILDYVPNHFALDHAWTESQPTCFIQGNETDFKNFPGLFFKTKKGKYLAHGKDPHFPPWSDTVQVNFFSTEMRKAALEILLRIAEFADGVRCDMAMLALNRIFEKNWRPFLKDVQTPKEEFWREVIGKVRRKYPEFIFMGEVYWDLEWELQQLGFNFTYDKKLYDRLLHASPSDIRGHLQALLSFQERSIRFVENHDEARAVTAFGPEKSKMAAAVMATIPGMRFIHDGQMAGRKKHLPIQLGAEPEENSDPETQNFYKRLMDFANQSALHHGKWQMINMNAAAQGNQSFQNLLAWAWQEKNQIRWVIINYSSSEAQGEIDLPPEWIPPESGLHVNLAPWNMQLLETKGKP